MTPSRATICLSLLSLLPALPAAPAAGAEISLFGELARGDFAAGEDTEIQALALRWVTGDALRWRIEVPYLRIESTGDVVPSGAGLLPGGRRRRGDPMAGGDAGRGDPGGGSGAMEPGHASPPGEGEEVVEEEWLSGLGDLRVGVAGRLAGGGARLYRLDAGLDLKLPTADEEEGLGTGEWDARVGLSGQYRFWSATAFGGVGWTRLGDPAWVELDDPFDAYAGVESEPLAGRVLLSGWLETTGEVVAGRGERTLAGVGLTAHVGGPRLELQVLAGLSDAAPDLAVVLGLSTGLRDPLAGPRGVRR